MIKSFEIVNKEIELIERDLQKIEDDEDVIFPFEILMCYLEKYSKIKQDLDVLNILDYRAVNIELFKEIINDYKNNNEKALYVYNLFEHEYRKLTMEELIKIKKFLLTNYEERVKELVGDTHE